MRHLLTCLAAALAALLLPNAAHAYEVSPLRIFLSPSQGRLSSTISVNNTRDEELLFEVKTFRRKVARDGSQTLEPVDSDFTAFPLQGRVAPKRSQAVRIQYRGAPVTSVSDSYVIQIAEVPVIKSGFSGVRFAYNFGVAVYVDPPRAEPRLQVQQPASLPNELRFSLVNSGNAYGFTTGRALRYRTADGATKTIEPDELAKLIDKPIVPPNSTRDFVVPLQGLSAGSVQSVELIDRTR